MHNTVVECKLTQQNDKKTFYIDKEAVLRIHAHTH